MYRLCVNVDESYQLYIDSMLVGVPYRYTVIVEYVVHRMNGRYSIDGGVPYDCTDILWLRIHLMNVQMHYGFTNMLWLPFICIVVIWLLVLSYKCIGIIFL